MPNDPSTWSASDRDLAVQMIANLAELLGCSPSNVGVEVRRLVARSATLKRAVEPSILADLEADDIAAIGSPWPPIPSKADEARATFRATILGACGLFAKGEEVRKIVASGRDVVLVSDGEEVGRVPAERVDVPSPPYLTSRWATLTKTLREAFAENLPDCSVRWQNDQPRSGIAAAASFTRAGARPVHATVYASGKATTGGPEGELRADVRAILASLGFEVRS